jgi:hypothetical protein
VSDQPEFIWARLDHATLYADGSSPCVARTKEFANGTKYARADASSQAEIERLKALLKSARSYVSDVASNNSAFLQEEAGHDLASIDAALSGSKE